MKRLSKRFATGRRMSDGVRMAAAIMRDVEGAEPFTLLQVKPYSNTPAAFTLNLSRGRTFRLYSLLRRSLHDAIEGAVLDMDAKDNEQMLALRDWARETTRVSENAWFAGSQDATAADSVQVIRPEGARRLHEVRILLTLDAGATTIPFRLTFRTARELLYVLSFMVYEYARISQAEGE